jgi:hypothetical protein
MPQVCTLAGVERDALNRALLRRETLRRIRGGSMDSPRAPCARVKGEPAHSEAGAGLVPRPTKRRHASVRAVGARPRKRCHPDAEGSASSDMRSSSGTHY